MPVPPPVTSAERPVRLPSRRTLSTADAKEACAPQVVCGSACCPRVVGFERRSDPRTARAGVVAPARADGPWPEPVVEPCTEPVAEPWPEPVVEPCARARRRTLSRARGRTLPEPVPAGPCPRRTSYPEDRVDPPDPCSANPARARRRTLARARVEPSPDPCPTDLRPSPRRPTGLVVPHRTRRRTLTRARRRPTRPGVPHRTHAPTGPVVDTGWARPDLSSQASCPPASSSRADWSVVGSSTCRRRAAAAHAAAIVSAAAADQLAAHERRGDRGARQQCQQRAHAGRGEAPGTAGILPSAIDARRHESHQPTWCSVSGVHSSITSERRHDSHPARRRQIDLAELLERSR